MPRERKIKSHISHANDDRARKGRRKRIQEKEKVGRQTPLRSVIPLSRERRKKRKGGERERRGKGGKIALILFPLSMRRTPLGKGKEKRRSDKAKKKRRMGLLHNCCAFQPKRERREIGEIVSSTTFSNPFFNPCWRGGKERGTGDRKQRWLSIL